MLGLSRRSRSCLSGQVIFGHALGVFIATAKRCKQSHRPTHGDFALTDQTHSPIPFAPQKTAQRTTKEGQEGVAVKSIFGRFAAEAWPFFGAAHVPARVLRLRTTRVTIDGTGNEQRGNFSLASQAHNEVGRDPIPSRIATRFVVELS
jgi:hypothetical protein